MWDKKVILRTSLVEIPKVNANLSLPVLFLDLDYVGQPDRVLYFSDEADIYQLIHLSFEFNVRSGCRASRPASPDICLVRLSSSMLRQLGRDLTFRNTSTQIHLYYALKIQDMSLFPWRNIPTDEGRSWFFIWPRLTFWSSSWVAYPPSSNVRGDCASLTASFS